MRVVVIGAGAAGLVSAAEAARRSADVILLEKNNKIGVKILMSGGTRCNVTQDTDAVGITGQFAHAQRFLQASVGAFPPAAVVQMFQAAGVPTKVEPTGKIFPISDRAIHVRDALRSAAEEAGVTIRSGTAVSGIERIDDDHWAVATEGESIQAERVIVTSGGKSYPGCGTTGDAYQWLKRLGHTIVAPRPALVPLVGGEHWTRELSGVALQDCRVSVHVANQGFQGPGSKTRTLVTRRGSLLLTHFGFSGPAAMDVSGVMTAADSFSDVRLIADLVPDLTEQEIRFLLTDRSRDGGRRNVSTVLGGWLPQRFANSLCARAVEDCSIAQLPRGAANDLILSLKRLPLPVSGTRGFTKAEVTAGGVSLAEVDPKTMASRIVKGLFIAGEVLDVDGPIGGYNFQAAFSTGRAAGIGATL